ncbi:AraC family transcriptional regulator [Thalassococcus sp. S3]|uniref:AraC family transcriptional regulator n=1 Tax=Thalassococcus sp. S3 TaxID=2017482 RepID=UPI0013EE5904|nr:AraC family transcriptional regulator [Thalassococcus sp. S3]
MPTQIAALTVSVMEQQGGDKAALFSGLPFSEDRLYEEDGRLSFSEIYALIEAALAISGTPWLGLEVGRAQTVSTWGILGYAIMSCATEREAVALGVRYYDAAPSLMRSTSRIENGLLRLQMEPIHPMLALLPFCVEENICGISTVSSEYLIEPMSPLEVWLSYPEPDYSDKYRTYFGCDIKYEQDSNVLWTRAPRDAPMRTSDPISAQLCRKLVEQVVEPRNDESDFIYQMRQLLLQTPGDMLNMERAAAELSISPRTLRRRLAEFGTSFKKLQEDTRRDLAIDYLRDTQLNISQIAHLLGYTETTNFRRAFKQWTGLPPRTFRQQHMG